MGAEVQCPNCETVNPPKMRFCGACGSHLAVQVPEQADRDTLIGSLVGDRFVILEKIAQGGMGVVYRAEQTAIWRPVALKVLRPKFSQDKKLLERFRNEASTASRLSHPNTITIYDFGVLEDSGLYIAMEYIEGKSLDDEIVEKGALDWKRACRIVVQICGSLQEAHEHNIIHRDLKLENIMLTRRGAEPDYVKVLDFGIAKIMADEGEAPNPSLTAQDEIFGTPEYMAPEQIRSEPLDSRTDIYALGIIMYRMLTGHLPFIADAPMALLAKHLMEMPPPFAEHRLEVELPPELEPLVMSCIAKQRDDRPARMNIIAERLLEVVDNASRARMPVAAPVTPAVDVQTRPRTEPRHEQPAPKPTAETAIIQPKDEQPGAASLPEVAEDANEPPAEEDWGADDDDALSDEPETRKGKREATLEALVEKMKNSRDFPAMSHNITEINTKASRDDTSARQLSNVILRDYGLTSKLLRLVNSPFYGQYRGRVMTVSRAVVILGFEQVRQIALGLMLFERVQDKNRGQANALLDSALNSLMTGLVAKGMADEVGRIDGEEALVCAMFRRLGEYLALYYFPKQTRKIRQLIKTKGVDEERAARRVLGISYAELGQAIADQWEFPDTIRASMNSLPQGTVTKSRDNNEMLRNLAGFAEELTQLTATTKPSQRKAKLKDLAFRHRENFSVSDEQLTDVAIEATKELRTYTKIIDMRLQDSRFMRNVFRWSGMTELPEPAAGKAPRFSEFPELDSLDPPPPLSEEPQVDQLKMRKQILASGTEEVALAMTSHYDLNSLLMMILETMYRGLGLSRIIFCLNEVKSGTMIARSGFGDKVEGLIRQFRFQPRRGRDVFNHAVSKGADIIVNDIKDSQYTSKLPAWYRRIKTPVGLLIYPVMVRNFPAGLFYGDQFDPKKKFNRGLLLHMDKLRNHAARAIREKKTTG